MGGDEGMPTLDGRVLAAPRFHSTGWSVGQRFTSEQDPDRVSNVWEPPRFIATKDPVQQREKTTVQELPLPELGQWRDSFARVVRNVLDESDCAEIIRLANIKGFTPALLNLGGGRQVLRPDVRDGHRVIVESPEFTNWLLEVLRPHLPEELNGEKLVELNERCRILSYRPGQFFEEHCDGTYLRPHGHTRYGDQSRVTIQFYLHDVPAHCGGATTFFPTDPVSSLAYQPERGSVLMFTQDLPHEGSLVEKGIKYTLRTEVMYSQPSAADLSMWLLGL